MWRRLYYVASLLGGTMALPAADGPVQTHPPAAARVQNISPRQDAGGGQGGVFDPSDLSWIVKLAAIGDSYSAGIGAGERLGTAFNAMDYQSDYTCSRYDHAYPYLIHHDTRLGDASKRKFQFRSCSGATSKDVLDQQIPIVDDNQKAILLSIGGNDIGLLDILNQCIYQWAVFNKQQVNTAKAAALKGDFKWADGIAWDKLGHGCEKQLKVSKSLIDGDEFSGNIDKVLKEAQKKLDKNGMIYMNGYAKFFNEEYTPECDDVSWSTWIYKSYNLFQPEAKLTKSRRKAMNALVDRVNSKLQAAAERAGSKVRFVNYDKYVGELGGRYCEPGVDESTKETNKRPGLMFYELDSFDPLGTNPWKRSDSSGLNGTFSADIDILARLTHLLDPDAKLRQADKIEDDSKGVQKPKADAQTPNINAESDTSRTYKIVPNFLPDGYGRVFHGQIPLHEMAANLVIYHMVSDNMKRSGRDAVPEILSIDACAYDPPKTPKPTSQNATTKTTKSSPTGTKTGEPSIIPMSTPYGFKCMNAMTVKHSGTPTMQCDKWWPEETEGMGAGGKVTCFPESRRPLDKYGAVRPNQYKKAAEKACSAYFSLWKHPPPSEGDWSLVYQIKDKKTPYRFNVGWKPGCRTIPGTISYNPFEKGWADRCQKIFKDRIFGGCGNNGGRGGYFQEKCLVYAFEPCSGDEDETNGCFKIGLDKPRVMNP